MGREPNQPAPISRKWNLVGMTLGTAVGLAAGLIDGPVGRTVAWACFGGFVGLLSVIRFRPHTREEHHLWRLAVTICCGLGTAAGAIVSLFVTKTPEAAPVMTTTVGFFAGFVLSEWLLARFDARRAALWPESDEDIIPEPPTPLPRARPPLPYLPDEDNHPDRPDPISRRWNLVGMGVGAALGALAGLFDGPVGGTLAGAFLGGFGGLAIPALGFHPHTREEHRVWRRAVLAVGGLGAAGGAVAGWLVPGGIMRPDDRPWLPVATGTAGLLAGFVACEWYLTRLDARRAKAARERPPADDE